MNYPTIYSLSTAGVRQHFCADYLIHPLRTDFTGDNGLGKSIISDLMQLIFVPQRDIWRPGTEGIDKNERRIEGIPLNRDFIQYCYAFLNIEKVRGKFIVIGAYIPKTSRLPVRPFIIQAGEDFENGQLATFDRPVKANDFFGSSTALLDLRDLKQHLKVNFNLHLMDFYHHNGIHHYYDILYKNYLLPIDLTKHGNLKAFAKIVQSYSRAKTLDITNSKSLQNFLFEDNDEIRQLFDDQRDKLEGYIRQYKENLRQIRNLELKQSKLFALREFYEKAGEARQEYLKADAIYAMKRMKEAELQDESNIKKLEGTRTSHEQTQIEWERAIRKLLAENIALKNICLEALTKFSGLRADYSDEKILAKKEEANRLRDMIRTAEEVEPVYKKYGSPDKMEKKLDEQEKYREMKGKLEKLLSITNFEQFASSEFVRSDYNSAIQRYRQRSEDLARQIEHLNTLLELFEGDKPDSLFDWAIRNNHPLTLAQETLLMHLKEVAVKRPGDILPGAKYTTNAKELLNSLEEDVKGIWIILGHLREYVPYINKQRFSDPQDLQAVIEKDISEIRIVLADAEKELAGISALNEEIVRIGFNDEYASLYRDREVIESYESDPLLSVEKIEKVKELADSLRNMGVLRDRFAVLDQETITFAKQQVEVENRISHVTQVLNKCESQIEKLLPDAGAEPVHLAERGGNAPEIHPESIREVIREYEGRIARLFALKLSLEQALTSEKGAMDGCRNLEPLLKKELVETRRHFDEKKARLEAETSIRVEELILTSDYSEEDVVRLLEKSARHEKEYQTEFTRVTETFEETRGNRNADLQTDEFNFQTLVNVLCGRLGLEGLAPELERLNEELKKFGELQLTLILDLFRKVETQYFSYKKLITELNFFFKDNRISGLYHFQIDFNDRKDIAIDWIARMREKARNQRLGSGLFMPAEYLPGEENSPEKLIMNLARTFSAINNCEITDLLNPKFYFDLRVGLYDDNQNRFSGSGGEAYTALALLCIGRLSVIQRDSFRPGVRFIIIEELSNIDDTNFNLFPEIAGQFGYQLLTMTPKPFGSFSNTEWYLHMLIRGKEKDINYHPMSFFRSKNFRQKLEEHMAGKTEETAG